MNRLAKLGDLIKTMRGGLVAATATQVPIRTADSLSLLSRWDTHQRLLHNSREKLVETCSLVLNTHVALLTTPSLRNISITRSH